MGSQDTDASPGYLRARVLRYWVCLLLIEQDRTMTVAEIAAALALCGLRVKGRPSKAISDTLRWATQRGWARQMGRGCYARGRIGESTVRYMRDTIATAIHRGDPVTAKTLARL